MDRQRSRGRQGGHRVCTPQGAAAQLAACVLQSPYLAGLLVRPGQGAFLRNATGCNQTPLKLHHTINGRRLGVPRVGAAAVAAKQQAESFRRGRERAASCLPPRLSLDAVSIFVHSGRPPAQCTQLAPLWPGCCLSRPAPAKPISGAHLHHECHPSSPPLLPQVPSPDGSGALDDHGVHAFVVPLRDEQGRLCDGVEIHDCGYKVGRGGLCAPACCRPRRSAKVQPAGQWAAERQWPMHGMASADAIAVPPAGGAEWH